MGSPLLPTHMNWDDEPLPARCPRFSVFGRLDHPEGWTPNRGFMERRTKSGALLRAHRTATCEAAPRPFPSPRGVGRQKAILFNPRTFSTCGRQKTNFLSVSSHGNCITR